MGLIIALVVVLAIVGITSLGVQLGLTGVFGVALPYLAIAIFIVGVIYRILNWAKVPVPFRIPTTCGQENLWILLRQIQLITLQASLRLSFVCF